MHDVCVIGAGIVGSWIALEAASRGLSVVLLDASPRPGDGISGRNSGVLHAGIYYEPSSLKARHCIEGRRAALEFLAANHVPFVVCGKIITTGSDAKAEDSSALEALFENARACGAEDLEIIARPAQICPEVQGNAAIYSRGTGVVDAPAYLKAVQSNAARAGAVLLPGRRAQAFDGRGVVFSSGRENETVEAQWIVNAAGLHSDDVASLFGVQGFEIRANRGEYFRLKKRLSRDVLVYPLPHTDSTALGVHYTFHLNGEAYAGPNSLWAADKEDYRITASAHDFASSLSRILSGYTGDDLAEGYAGLRPRLFRNGAAVKDFVIHRHPANVIHMLGIESPGLTASPSLARHVVDMMLA